MTTAIPMTNVDRDSLQKFVSAGFEALGLTAEDAGIFAGALIFSELRFHPGQGQGVARLRRYHERIGNGEVDPRAGWSIIKEGPALALVDAHNGIGTVAASKAMRLAIKKAKEGGIGTVIVRNSTHYGSSAVHACQALDQGCIGIAYTNAGPEMAPWGGREGVTGTNPWSIAAPSDHGLQDKVQGLAIGSDGTLFLVGNRTKGAFLTGIVRRGSSINGSPYIWTTLAKTVDYVGSGSPSDHRMNGIAVSPDGLSVFVNHGSRTDHGEERTNGGLAPGAREMPITSLILKLPVNATDLVLPNDEAALTSMGVLFADGVRNTFDLAFDASDRLYGAENSGDRDDPDELNWIREGRQYEFPWRMGDNDTPRRFPRYEQSRICCSTPSQAAVNLTHSTTISTTRRHRLA